jgi:FKBP-type peptidyl-prolyl cis-trans isomerase
MKTKIAFLKTTTFMSCFILLSPACMFSNKRNSSQTSKGVKMNQGTKLSTQDFKQYKNTGILHLTTQEGSGIYPIRGQKVSVHYTGWLLEGTDTLGKKFDSSVDRGQKFEFPVGLGHVIPGWDLMVSDMKPGEKRIVILPSDMAYGQRGAGALIPPYATLVFEIELFGSR